MNEIKLVGPEIKGWTGETVSHQDVNELLIDKEIKLI
jgi:hypothetical protein